MPCIRVKGVFLPFVFRRSQRAKRLQLVQRPTFFEMVVPMRLSLSVAFAFLWQHQTWMLKQWEQKKDPLIPAQFRWPDVFLPGVTLPFQGKHIVLALNNYSSPTPACLENEILRVNIPTAGLSGIPHFVIRQRIREWYYAQAKEKAHISLLKFCPRLGKWPTSVHIKEQKTRWGSCGIDQKIYLNWVLMLGPEEVFEYVVVHELCHLFYRNHGKRFWAKVKGCLPDYAQSRAWLRQYGAYLQPLGMSSSTWRAREELNL